MPYSGPDDDKLPDRIKKMPAKKRRAFVSAFNSAYRDGDEGRAFAIANAAANRAGAKDMDEYAAVEIPIWGGATSFAELDTWSAAQRVAHAVDWTLEQFNGLMRNVGHHGNDAERYEKAQALVEELADRIKAVQADPEIAFKDAALDPVYPEVVSAGEKEGAVTAPDGTFLAYKDADGAARWVTIHTNKFIDRDREIFTEQAHCNYVARVDASKNYPDLQLWHTPVPIGRADMIDYDDRGFVIASGTYLPGYEDVGERLAELAKEQPLGCSHGFKYDRLDRLDGVFDWYDTREITVLPLRRAANLLTTSHPLGSKEIEMLNTEKAAFLERALGPERFAAEIEGKLDELARKAADEGLDFKDDEAAVAEPPAVEVVTADPPAAVPEPAPATTSGSGETVTISAPSANVTGDQPAGALVGQVLAAIAEQGGLDAPADDAPADAPAADAPVAAPTDEAPAAAAEPQAEAKDETIPEHPIETPQAAAPEAPIDLGSNEAQVLSLLRKAMTEVITPVMDRMAAIETKQDDLARDNEAIKAAQGRSFDEAIATAITPRVGPPAVTPASANGAAPTEAEVAAIAGLKAEAEKSDNGVPPHVAPFLQGMMRPVIEN